MREIALDTQAWSKLLGDDLRQHRVRDILRQHPEAHLLLPNQATNELCVGGKAVDGFLALGNFWSSIGFSALAIGRAEQEILEAEIRGDCVPINLLTTDVQQIYFNTLMDRDGITAALADIQGELEELRVRRARLWTKDALLRQGKSLAPIGDHPGLDEKTTASERVRIENELASGSLNLQWWALEKHFPGARVHVIEASPSSYRYCHTWVALFTTITLGNLIGSRSSETVTTFRSDRSSWSDSNVALAAARADFLVTDDVNLQRRCRRLRELGLLTFETVSSDEFLSRHSPPE